MASNAGQPTQPNPANGKKKKNSGRNRNKNKKKGNQSQAGGQAGGSSQGQTHRRITVENSNGTDDDEDYSDLLYDIDTAFGCKPHGGAYKESNFYDDYGNVVG